jgi:hypothetical protein
MNIVRRLKEKEARISEERTSENELGSFDVEICSEKSAESAESAESEKISGKGTETSER